jgi:hypothetical protein
VKPEPQATSSPRIFAEPAERECPECPYLRIFKSTVYVRDHDKSLKFYVDQLGFSIVAGSPSLLPTAPLSSP